MFRQYKLVIIVVLISIFGVIGFQTMWLKQNYELLESQYQQKINRALNDAVNHYFTLQASGLKEILKDANSGVNVIEYSSGSISDSFHFDSIQMMNKASVSVMVHQDSVYDNTDLNGEDFQQELKALQTNKFLKGIIPGILGELMSEPHDIQVIDSLFALKLKELAIEAESRVVEDLKEDLPSGVLVSKAFPLSLSRKEQVKAIVSNGDILIIKDMWLPIVGSISLVVLLYLSFYFMFRIIQQQKRMNEVKNDFINNMTHEFKTPLSSVYATIEALLNFGALDDRPRAEKYLGVAKGELDRLSGMVQQILNAAVNEREKIVLEKEPVELEDLMQHLVDRHRMASGKEIDFSMNQKTGKFFKADKAHFYNVMNNLVDNAVKYSDERVKLHVVLEEVKGGVCLSISDKGIGMKKDHLNEIFDQFYRVPTGDRHDVKGFGLGLSYVKKIVDLHGWSIEVESEWGVGTIFKLLIPEEHE